MVMKKLLVTVLALMALFMSSCSTSLSHNSSNNENGEKSLSLTKEDAIRIAQEEVTSTAANFKSDMWEYTSVVTEAFPVYIDGVEGVSYYECKVETNGEDAGYVLVNINKSDLLITEATPEGLTLTEQYQTKSRMQDFKLYRYSFIKSVVTTSESRSVTTHNVLASSGFDASEKISTNVNILPNFDEFRGKAMIEQCNPLYTRAYLDEYYNELEEENISRASYKNIKSELSYTMSNGWHTPQFYQYKTSRGYPVGCGPVAWGIVYGYHKAFRGYSKLFNGYNIKKYNDIKAGDDREVKRCIDDCARYCKTKYGGSGSNKYGLTWPKNFPLGINYAKNDGYGFSFVNTITGSEFSKFNTAYYAIKGNTPPVLLIHADGTGGANHYVVLEAANKKQKKVLGKYRDREVKYLANFGWGGTRKWIYTREVGANDHKHYSAYDLYVINLNK